MAASLLVGLLAMLALPGPAAGQWSQIGPDGGYTVQVLNDPVTPTTSYAATFGGVYKTIDGGDHWVPVGPGLFLREVAIAASNPNVLYAQGGRFGIAASIGIYKSTDGGASWTIVFPMVSPTMATSIAVHPTNPSIVYAATQEDGLFKTVDGGATWAHSDAGLTTAFGYKFLYQVLVDPLTPSTVFVVADGIFKSTDAGVTWAPSNSGLPAATSGLLAIDPQSPSTLYFARGTIYKSTNGGASWAATPMTGLPADPVIWAIAVDPTTTSTLYVREGYGSTSAVYRSVDGAGSWSATGCTGLASDSIAVGTDGVILLAAENNIGYPLHGGVYRSTDAAASCALASRGITAFRVTALAAAGTLYMGDADTGTYRTTDFGATWSSAHGTLSGIEWIVHDLAVDPSTPATVYQTSGNGLNDQVWKSVDAGDSWTSVLGPLPFFRSLAVDPTDGDHVLLGIGRFEYPSPPILIPAAVGRTTDGGATWTRYNVFGADVPAVAIAAANPLVAFAANDADVLKSIDGGATFPTAGIGLPFDEKVLDVEVAPSNASIVYALTTNFGASSAGGVFLSADGGATFVRRSGGIETLYGKAIAVDPLSSGTLYLATDGSGVYRTTNGGSSWQPVNDGLTNPFTEDIVVDPTIPGRVYVGTAFSSVFVADLPPECPPGSDGDPCDDGDACTDGDACAGGVCQGAPATCGDGVVAGCEACDDGAANGTSASCCTVACQPVASGTSCADDGDLCTRDRCDAGGACGHAVERDPLCIAPSTGGGVLKIADRTGTGRDQVTFKWAKGPAIAKPAFGDPNGTTAFALCVYDGAVGGDVLVYRGRPGPPCSKSPCWTDVSTGWRFKSPGGTDGVTRVVLKSGTDGRAKIQVKAKGAPLAVGPLPLASTPSVSAELRSSDGACWGATFSTALKNSSDRFSARSD
jgi:photosystem II stability/assembly factor-like uncharacterized protein